MDKNILSFIIGSKRYKSNKEISIIRCPHLIIEISIGKALFENDILQMDCCCTII